MTIKKFVRNFCKANPSGLWRPRFAESGASKVLSAYKPDSVPLDKEAVTIHLVFLLPRKSCGQPGNSVGTVSSILELVSLFGLAPSGVCKHFMSPRNLVRSYRTLSPLPVCLRHHRRSILCGTFRRLTTPGNYPALCPRSPDFPLWLVLINRAATQRSGLGIFYTFTSLKGAGGNILTVLNLSKHFSFA